MGRSMLVFILQCVLLASATLADTSTHNSSSLMPSSLSSPPLHSGSSHSSSSSLLWSHYGAAADEKFEVNARSIAAVVIAFLVASLAASAGVGGGAFFVPLYMLALGFGLKDATVLSQCTIAAVSAASIFFNLPKRHPTDPSQPLIAYELLLTLTPALLLGSGIGVILNVALPTWLITTMLIGLLLFMSTRTTQKGLQQWRGETKAKRQAAAEQAEAEADEEAAAQASEQNAAGDVVVITDGATAAAAAATGVDAKPAKKLSFPWSMALGVVFLWCGFAVLQLLRSQAVRCSPAFYGVIAGQVVFGFGCSTLFAYFCLAKPAREAEGEDGLAAPLLASSSTNSLSSLLVRQQHHQQANMLHLMATIVKVTLAGVVAGVVGVGGGLLMAPMLLDAGIHPQSTSATSNILVFMSSSTAALAFFLEGRVPLQYAAVFSSVCGTASLLGLTAVGRLVKGTGRPSIVVLLLAFIMGAGGLCSAVFGYLDAWQHGDVGFKSIC